MSDLVRDPGGQQVGKERGGHPNEDESDEYGRNRGGPRSARSANDPLRKGSKSSVDGASEDGSSRSVLPGWQFYRQI